MGRCNCVLLLSLGLLVLLAGCGGTPSGPQVRTKGPLHSKALGPEDYLAWQEAEGNPVLGPTADAALPCVLHDGSRYLMWTDNESGGVYLRTSPDGLTWSGAAACGGLRSGARHARILFNPALGAYEIWYWDGGNDYDFSAWWHAHSGDGVSWTGNTRLYTFGSASGHRCVYTLYGANIGSQGPAQIFYNGGTATTLNYTDLWQNPYVMYYHLRRDRDGANGLAVAVSLDGITWGAPTEGRMVLEPGAADGWDSKSATMGSLFRADGLLHMYYAGGRSYAFGGDGIGYASSADGLTWTKAAAPIMTTADGVPWRAHYLGPPSALLAQGQRTLFIYVWNGSDRLIGVARAPDLDPPTVTLAASPETVDCPADGSDVSVTVSGSAADSSSALASATLTIGDEYGTAGREIDLLPRLGSGGAFSETVNLSSAVNQGDADGRTYTFTLSAQDAHGNAASPVSATVHCLPGDTDPPAVTLEASETVLWPPDGKDVPVTVSGSAGDSGSGLLALTLDVADEYEVGDREIDLLPLLDPSNGHFDCTVTLNASRRKHDDDGRQYVLTLYAKDMRGNVATPLTLSLVCPQRGPGEGWHRPGHGRPHPEWHVNRGHGGRGGRAGGTARGWWRSLW